MVILRLGKSVTYYNVTWHVKYFGWLFLNSSLSKLYSLSVSLSIINNLANRNFLSSFHFLIRFIPYSVLSNHPDNIIHSVRARYRWFRSLPRLYVEWSHYLHQFWSLPTVRRLASGQCWTIPMWTNAPDKWLLQRFLIYFFIPNIGVY